MEQIWAPHVLDNLKESDLALYLEFSCSACIPSGACNVDRALQVLYQSNGDIKVALERLIANGAQNSIYNNNDDHAIWTEDEVQCFERLIKIHGKNFSHISAGLRTKTVKECVEFYYLWKKSPLRNAPRQVGLTTVSNTITPPPTDSNNNIITTTTSCQTQQQAATSFTTTTTPTPTPNIMAESNCDATITKSAEEQFPCKVCGRVFLKIKSRSAHMKRHKNER